MDGVGEGGVSLLRHLSGAMSHMAMRWRCRAIAVHRCCSPEAPEDEVKLFTNEVAGTLCSSFTAQHVTMERPGPAGKISPPKF